MDKAKGGVGDMPPSPGSQQTRPHGRTSCSSQYLRQKAHHNNNRIEDEISSLESRLSSLLKSGSLEVAEDVSRTILAVRQKISSKDDPRALGSKMNLAAIFYMRSRFEQAEQLQEEELREMKVSLGKDHRLTVQCTLNQAETFASRGRTEETVSLLQNTLNTLPIHHEQSTAVKSGLAVKLVALNRLADAKTLFLEVMNIHRDSLGPMNPGTLCTMANLVGVYFQLRRWKLSEQTAKSVLPAMKKTLRTKHPHTMSCMRHLALALQNQGQYQGAETQFLELMRCHDQIHGKEHLETFKCKSEIASMYKAMGRYEEAEEFQESAINGLKDTAGEDHLETIGSKNGMILLYIALGRYNDAVALGEPLAKRTENILGARHPNSLDSMQNLALAYSHQGLFQDAERLEEWVLQGWTAMLGESHPNAITTRCNLALTRFDLGKKDEAKKLLTHDQNNVSIFPPNSDPATLQRLLNFAGALSEDGFHATAIAIAEYVFETRKEKFGNDDPEALIAIGNLGMTHYKNHDNEKALELLMESILIGERRLRDKHRTTLINQFNLALVQLDRGETDLAEDVCKTIVDDLKHELGPTHKTCIECEKDEYEYENEEDGEKDEEESHDEGEYKDDEDNEEGDEEGDGDENDYEGPFYGGGEPDGSNDESSISEELMGKLLKKSVNRKSRTSAKALHNITPNEVKRNMKFPSGFKKTHYEKHSKYLEEEWKKLRLETEDEKDSDINPKDLYERLQELKRVQDKWRKESPADSIAWDSEEAPDGASELVQDIWDISTRFEIETVFNDEEAKGATLDMFHHAIRLAIVQETKKKRKQGMVRRGSSKLAQKADQKLAAKYGPTKLAKDSPSSDRKIFMITSSSRQLVRPCLILVARRYHERTT